MIRPRRLYRCSVCGGRAYRRTNVALRMGQEDTSLPLLHALSEDWQAHPHEVVPADDGIETEQLRRRFRFLWSMGPHGYEIRDSESDEVVWTGDSRGEGEARADELSRCASCGRVHDNAVACEQVPRT